MVARRERTVMCPQALALKEDKFWCIRSGAAMGSLVQWGVALVVGEVEVRAEIAEHLAERV